MAIRRKRVQETPHVKQLGHAVAWPESPDEATLERVPNPHPDKLYLARFTAPEFTSLCPKTGQPDFGTLTIAYTPAAKCVELKSLKFYLQSFRNEGIFYEHVTNAILDDLVAVLSPRWMKVESAFNPRGGTTEKVTVQYAAVA